MTRLPIPFVLLLASCAFAEPNMTPANASPVGVQAPKPPAPALGTTLGAPIMMLGEINEFSGTLWATQIKIAAAQKPAAIFVVINSPGGHADEGVRILSEMRQAAANGSPVVCKVQGQAGSMAAAILEAGCARRQMTAGSVLMFHEICFNGPPKFPNPHRILRQDLQHFANELEDDNMKIAVLSAPRLKFTAAQFAQWISDHDRYLGAPEALDLGAIDEIVP